MPIICSVYPHTYSVLYIYTQTPSASIQLCLYLPYSVLCTPVSTRSREHPPSLRTVYLPNPRRVYICLHSILWTSGSTYMPLLMHYIPMPPPCHLGLFPSPTHMILPRFPPHMYRYEPRSMFLYPTLLMYLCPAQPVYIYLTLSCEPQPHSALCISI